MYDEEKLKQMEAKNIEYPDGSMHTLYEAEQKQRAYERKIRESKRILAAYDESIKNADDEAIKKAYQNIFNKESVKLKNREAELNNFCDKTGLLKRNDRVQKYGFNKTISQKVIDSNNNFLINSNYNDIIYMKENYLTQLFADGIMFRIRKYMILLIKLNLLKTKQNKLILYEINLNFKLVN